MSQSLDGNPVSHAEPLASPRLSARTALLEKIVGDYRRIPTTHAHVTAYGLNSRGSSVNGTTATMVMRAASGCR
jgi:hypothetical protein